MSEKVITNAVTTWRVGPVRYVRFGGTTFRRPIVMSKRALRRSNRRMRKLWRRVFPALVRHAYLGAVVTCLAAMARERELRDSMSKIISLHGRRRVVY